ncbi:MAG: hypothetical protein EOO39_38275 [Cytophagaceae bacterium]|nr:MAG: hypothetical protein EOO39_38275 [Cytophagaceae bacterium]
MKRLGLLLCLVLLIGGCDTNAVYKEYTDIEDGKWYIKNAPSFTFEITDATQPYNIYYNLRNSLSYGYYNLYLTRYLRDANGKEIESRLDELIRARNSAQRRGLVDDPSAGPRRFALRAVRTGAQRGREG